MRQVILLGSLGDLFGREHLFDIRFPREAINALGANFKSFRSEIAKGSYKILIGQNGVNDLGELNKPFSKKETITIVPVIEGANSGIGKVFAGVLILGAAVGLMIWNPAASPWVGKVGLGLLGVGLSTTVGGITQLLTPIPKAPVLQKGTDPSYAFGGPINTSVQGYPIPVVYGQMIVGSKVISAGITIEEIY